MSIEDGLLRGARSASSVSVLDLQQLLLLRQRYEQSLGAVYAHHSAGEDADVAQSEQAVAEARKLGWMFHAQLAHQHAKLQQQQQHQQRQRPCQQQQQRPERNECKETAAVVPAATATASASTEAAEHAKSTRSTPFFTRSLQQIAATARERSEIQVQVQVQCAAAFEIESGLSARTAARTATAPLARSADDDGMLSTGMTFRPITRADLATLRHLNTVTLPMSVWRSYDQQYYEALLRAPDELTKFACLNGKVVGAICARIEHPGAQYNNARLHVLTVSVLPRFRRRGVATALLRGVIAACEERWEHRHVREFYLRVQASNDGARAVYSRCGFRVAAAQAGYYKDAANGHDGGAACIVMTRSVHRGAPYAHHRSTKARRSMAHAE